MEAVDVLKDGGFCLAAGFPNPAPDQLGLDGLEERLDNGVGPVPVLFRSFDHILCSKGDEPWAQAGRVNFAKKRCE